MGNDIHCPYAETIKHCAKCINCHAINPPSQAANRRVCTRTRQWPGCKRYNEAWNEGVLPYDPNYAVTPPEMRQLKDLSDIVGGIGGIAFTGIPMEAGLTSEPPCMFLVYVEGGCKSCGGYTCTATSSDKKIMPIMLDTCKYDPDDCGIHNNKME